MNKEINMDEWLNGTTPFKEQKPAEVVPNIIDVDQLKNFNQIKAGVGVRAAKQVLMTNPTGYQKLFDELGNAARADGLTFNIVDTADAYIVTFK